MLAASAIAPLVARWAHLYNDTRAVATSVTFLHFGGMVLAGGFAVVADSLAFRMSAASRAEWAHEIADFPSVHAWVLWGLVVTCVTGVLMTLADLHTYATSLSFWIKMGLLVLLLVNGYGRVRAERAVQGGGAGGWRWLRRTSLASVVLWFAIVLVSTILNTSS